MKQLKSDEKISRRLRRDNGKKNFYNSWLSQSGKKCVWPLSGTW